MNAVFTCPWCGTNYLAFQTNCSNCGGPLLAPTQGPTSPATKDELPVLPPAPRSISSRYAWRLLSSDAWAVVALILGMLGAVFAVVGAGLTLAVVTALVGIPFFVIGAVFLAFALPVIAWRHGRAQKVVTVLREGAATEGRIIESNEQYSVQVNGRHPWIIRYGFRANGQPYEGRVTTLNQQGQPMPSGRAVQVLYLQEAPQWNSIFPHP